MKHFNVTGLCTPAQDYMVDISHKIKQIRTMVDAGEYFTINRARQYGKTTTLQTLKNSLNTDYIVSRISFEGVGGMLFSDESRFCLGFNELFTKSLRFSSATPDDIAQWTEYTKKTDNFAFSRYAPPKISRKKSRKRFYLFQRNSGRCI